MFLFPKTAKGYAYLYMLMILPLLALFFSSNLIKGKVFSFDPWLLLAFCLVSLMTIVFLVVEIRKKIFQKILPYWIIVLVGFVSLITALISVLSKSSLRLFLVANFIQDVIQWGIFLVVCIFIPISTFSQKPDKKMRVFSILIAILYALYHFIPIMAVSPRLRFFLVRLGVNLAQAMNWLIILFFILAIAMYSLSSDRKNNTWFLVLCLGLGTTFFGIANPVKYESRGLFWEKTYINGVFSGSRITELLNFNLWAMVGSLILCFMFIIYLTSKRTEK